MLLPAVQKVRDAAAKSTCSNNLKQLGLAAQNFHESYGYLPPQAVAAANQPTVRTTLHDQDGFATWAVLLLPYIEQDNVYKQWTLGRLVSLQPAAAVQQQIKTYICPSR